MGPGMDMREGETLLLVGTMDGMMHAVSGLSGDLLWSFNSGGQVVSSSKLAILEAEVADALIQGEEARERGREEPPPPQQEQQQQQHEGRLERPESELHRERPTPTEGAMGGLYDLEAKDMEDVEEGSGAAAVPLPPLRPPAKVDPPRVSTAPPPPMSATSDFVHERHGPSRGSPHVVVSPPPPVVWPEVAPPPLVAPPTRQLPPGSEYVTNVSGSPPLPPSPPPLMRRPSIASWLGPKRKQTSGMDGVSTPRSPPPLEESSHAEASHGGQDWASDQHGASSLDGESPSDGPDATSEDAERDDADADELLVVPGLDGSLFVVDDDGAAHPLSDHTVQVMALCLRQFLPRALVSCVTDACPRSLSSRFVLPRPGLGCRADHLC